MYVRNHIRMLTVMANTAVQLVMKKYILLKEQNVTVVPFLSKVHAVKMISILFVLLMFVKVEQSYSRKLKFHSLESVII